MHPEIEKLIDMALIDGQVNDKEREIILRKAEKLSLDIDEVEMYLEGKISANDINLKPNNNSHSEIELLTFQHPITGRKFQAAIKDFEITMSWDLALKSCNDLGDGWRMPYIEELEVMVNVLNFDSGFSDDDGDGYWSSNEVKNRHNVTLGVCFSYLLARLEFLKSEKLKVRAVRNI